MDDRPNERLHECDGDDEQCRLGFSLNVFAERARDSFLDIAFFYYDALRGDGRTMPLAADFQPYDVLETDDRRTVTFIDVRPAAPENFVVTQHPGGPLDLVHGGMTGKLISEFPSRIHASACMAEYQRCKSIGLPYYCEINQIVCGLVRAYARLLLPLVDERGEVTTLACVNQIFHRGFRFDHIEKVSARRT